MKQIGFFRVKMLIRIWTSFAIFLSVFALKIQAKPVNFSVECADFRRTALKAHELTLSATSFDPSFHNSGKMMKILLCSNWILVFILEPSICPRKSTECCNAEVELQLRTKARNSYMESLRGILAPMRADFGTYLRDLQSKQYVFLIFTGGPKWKLILAPVFLLLFFIVCHCLRMSIFFLYKQTKKGEKNTTPIWPISFFWLAVWPFYTPGKQTFTLELPRRAKQRKNDNFPSLFFPVCSCKSKQEKKSSTF